MISPLILEQDGRWRYAGVAAILALVVLPVVPLVVHALSEGRVFDLGTGFGGAVGNSIVTAAIVAALALLIGLPTGVALAIYKFRGRALLMTLLLLPAVAPSFLWAIAWSALAGRLGMNLGKWLDAGAGPVLSFLSLAVPLVTFASLAAARSLTASQMEAARIAGGEKVVMRYAMRDAFPVAALAAALAGAMTVSDPGPGLIFGRRTAASELLTSFASLYDFALAGRQALAMAVVVLAATLPAVILASPRLAEALLARQVRGLDPVFHRRAAALCVMGAGGLVIVLLIVPVVGLLLPLTSGIDWTRAGDTLKRTTLNTLIYAAGTGLIVGLAGILLSACTGRAHRLRQICLMASLVLLALPPTLPALGLLRWSASAPAWADPILRSRAAVCASMAQHLFPIGLLLGLRAFSRMSPSWASVAAVHGVPLSSYLCRVMSPLLLPAFAAAALLAALFASADVTSVLLLHPPGEQSMALALFSVMANAPESLVASLSAAYLMGAALLLLPVLALTGGGRH